MVTPAGGDAAREAARAPDGRFGEQARTESTVDLTGPAATPRASVDDEALEVARARDVPFESFGGVMNGAWYPESSQVAECLNHGYASRGEPTVRMEEGQWGDDSLYLRVVDTDGKSLGLSSMDWKDLADEDPDTTGEDAFREYARALDSERAYLLRS